MTPWCAHQLRVANFQPADVTPCPIVRLLGHTAPSRSPACPDPPTISLALAGTERTLPARRRFTALLEVEPGPNDVILEFGCRRVHLKLTYAPLASPFTVLPLYVICRGHDGHFQAPPAEPRGPASACRRIHLAVQLLQTFTAERLQGAGLGRRTFTLEGQCLPFHSHLHVAEARAMSQGALWARLGREIMRSPLGSARRKFLAVLACTRYRGAALPAAGKSREDLLRVTEGYVALGGGGLALFGSASLHTWPEALAEVGGRFADATPIDQRHLLDDSGYRGTHGASFSTTLGAVLHELFHCFDLGHSEGGVMGRGFDQISRFFLHAEEEEEEEEEARGPSRLQREEEEDRTPLEKSCAVLLAYHRWFNCLPGGGAEEGGALRYDPQNGALRSRAGIRVVEVRRREDQLILQAWTFEGRVLRHFFQLPPEARQAPFLLVVEDNGGHILKQETH